MEARPKEAAMESSERQLVFVVEGTAAMGPFWNSLFSDYLDKIVLSFHGTEVTGQKNSVELALVVFNAHGPHSACLVQRSGWTRDVDVFLHWLGNIRFCGGGFGEVVIAESLAEALMMLSIGSHGIQAQQNGDCQKHCILFAASNPYPLPTPVPRLPSQNMEQKDGPEIAMENILFDAEAVAKYFPQCLVSLSVISPKQLPKLKAIYNAIATENILFDAEAVAKYFPQCLVSLSVISPKQLPKLKAIYNAGKRNPRATEPAVENVKNPHFLILLSENFLEARAALNKSGMANLPATQIPMKMDTNSGPPMLAPSRIANPSANGSVMRQPMSMGNIPAATVKVEPSTVPSVVPGPGFSHMPTHAVTQGAQSLPTTAPLPTSESMPGSELVQEVKPVITGMQPQIRSAGAAAANVSILNSISSQARVMSSGANPIGLQNMGNTPMAMHMSNMISTGMTSSALPTSQTSLSSVSSAITAISGSGPVVGAAQISQNTAPNSFSSTSLNITGNSNIGIQPSLASNAQGSIGLNQSIPNMGPGSLTSGAQMGQNGIAMTQGSLGSSGISAGVVGMIPTPGMSQQVGMQPLNTGSGPQANMPLPQNTSAVPPQSKYLKVWEGALSGQRQGQPVYICRLEGYRNATASESLANDWPPTMQIVRLISQDHMNNKQYLGKADFLVFRALNQHGFLSQLQEKKLCAVIQLPSQTLLLSVSEKASRLIGMLFPGDMVVFKPQVPSHQQQQQSQQQQLQLSQQQQQLSQQQPMIGVGMNQQFLQGHGRAQVMPQGQLPTQGLPSGGFLP